MYRITCLAAGQTPSRVEKLESAGCPLLDQSAMRFLAESRIPLAGTFEIRIRFEITRP